MIKMKYSILAIGVLLSSASMAKVQNKCTLDFSNGDLRGNMSYVSGFVCSTVAIVAPRGAALELNAEKTDKKSDGSLLCKVDSASTSSVLVLDIDVNSFNTQIGDGCAIDLQDGSTFYVAPSET